MDFGLPSVTDMLALKHFFAWLLVLVCCQGSTSLTLQNGDTSLTLNLADAENTVLSFTLNGNEVFSGHIGDAIALELPEDCEGSDTCVITTGDVSLSISSVERGFKLSWTAPDSSTVFQDCLNLVSDQVKWFGGPERWNSEWPVENLQLANMSYRTTQTEYGAIAERYWLNSRGGYVFIDEKVPLFLEQNSIEPERICFIAKAADPYLLRERVLLEYVLVAHEDPKQAQLHAVKNYLGQPTGHPNERVIQYPIWTTWSKYKKEIDDASVLDFAQGIADNGFTGQIEIDDYWETCYGSLIFNDVQFPNINETIQTLHDQGFTVSLWVHPFVNTDCEEPMTVGEENGYFAKTQDGNEDTTWWDGDSARHIDFTNELAMNWFLGRLDALKQKHGFDSYKFDAGESDWAPIGVVLNGDVELAPNSLTSAYIRACSTLGDLIEVRSGFRTQDLPMLVRMLDKDSRWGLDAGLHSVITTLLQMNMVGYTIVLPDIIGGDAYAGPPNAELLARWTQANTFMITMQFSFLPWEITSDEFDGVAIIKKYVALHEQYSDEILNAITNSINDGVPVNPPIWWVDPMNEDLYSVNDEYLLGDKILVAPIIYEGATSRDIVLPAGLWKDGNDDKSYYLGPGTIRNYPAPIEVLPYFIRQ